MLCVGGGGRLAQRVSKRAHMIASERIEAPGPKLVRRIVTGPPVF
jgi:hypothetical protein